MENEKGKWATDQLNKEQAIAMGNSKAYENWTPEQVVRFQLFQHLMCMDFSYYHKCIEEVLGRPVWTHEFAFRDSLVEEYLGTKEMPTMEEIINLIPKEKRLIIGI